MVVRFSVLSLVVVVVVVVVPMKASVLLIRLMLMLIAMIVVAMASSWPYAPSFASIIIVSLLGVIMLESVVAGLVRISAALDNVIQGQVEAFWLCFIHFFDFFKSDEKAEIASAAPMDLLHSVRGGNKIICNCFELNWPIFVIPPQRTDGPAD